MNEQLPTPKPIEEGLSTTHIEASVVPAESSTEEVVTSLDDPTTNQAPENTRPDVSKAWDMAHAGKENRDEAARSRIVAKDLQSLTAEDKDRLLSEREKLLTEYPEYTDEQTDKYNETEFAKRFSEMRNRGPVNTWKEDVTTDQYFGHNGEDKDEFDEKSFDDLAEMHERDAAEEDLEAHGKEEWAGITHDHPPTEAFKKQFDLEDGDDSKHLFYLERECLEKQKDLQATMDKIEELSLSAMSGNDSGVAKVARYNLMYDIPSLEENGMDFEADVADKQELLMNPRKLMARAFGDQSEQMIEWQALSLSPNTTLSQLQEKYLQAFEKLLKPSMDSSKVTLAVLEQIRNGNASRWQ